MSAPKAVAKTKVVVRETPEAQLWTDRDVREILRVSRSWLWHLRKTDPRFPRPLRIAKRRLWYRADHIKKYARACEPRP